MNRLNTGLLLALLVERHPEQRAAIGAGLAVAAALGRERTSISDAAQLPAEQGREIHESGCYAITRTQLGVESNNG